MMRHVVEIRVLTLKPGARGEFRRVFMEQSLPLLNRWQFDVVAHGPSLHDENTYYVIRRFDSLAERGVREDAFYSSDDWKAGPREALVSRIESYTDAVLAVDDATLAGLRQK